MELIEWLRQKRLENGLKLSDLAQKTGLSHATLSRVENQRSDLTLFTAVRIMQSLGLSWTDLFSRGFVREGLFIPTIYREQNNNYFEYPCFVISDFDVLDSSDLIGQGAASSIVTAFIRLFIKKYAPNLSDDKVELLAPAAFSPKNMSPHADNLFQQYLPDLRFGYPTNFPYDNLQKIYLSRGVFILSDLGAYVRHLRESKKLSLRELAGLINTSHTAVEDFEINLSNRVKLSDIINLDNALNFTFS